jgi:hypothetical protein
VLNKQILRKVLNDISSLANRNLLCVKTVNHHHHHHHHRRSPLKPLSGVGTTCFLLPFTSITRHLHAHSSYFHVILQTVLPSFPSPTSTRVPIYNHAHPFCYVTVIALDNMPIPCNGNVMNVLAKSSFCIWENIQKTKMLKFQKCCIVDFALTTTKFKMMIISVILFNKVDKI